MKRSLAVMLVLSAFVLLTMGCSRTQKVISTQGDLTASYQSLGQIEIERHVPRASLKRMFQHVGEWMTFGKYEMPARSEYLQGLLDKKLVKAAKKRHGAEAVIKVQYWPDLNSEKFPSGKMYAKGEMVRYKRFAS